MFLLPVESIRPANIKHLSQMDPIGGDAENRSASNKNSRQINIAA